MTRDDIIRMARDAKLPYEYDTGRILYLKELERFAALVATNEREECAKTIERARLKLGGEQGLTNHTDHVATRVVDFLAAAVRERGEQE